MLITPDTPDQSARGGFKHGSNLNGNLCSSRVTSQRESTHKAKEVWPGLRTGHSLVVGPDGIPPTDQEIDAFFAHEVKEKDDVTLSSAHTHGGNPMSVHPDDGVVDLRCRVHGVGNLLVADASVFPGNIRVNAHFSTMALAEYATGPEANLFA